MELTGRWSVWECIPTLGAWERSNMISDTEIKIKGIRILAEYLGDIEMERFIALIQREPFDYTKWCQQLDEEMSIEEISRSAMSLGNKKT
jgi:hypothetical protein